MTIRNFGNSGVMVLSLLTLSLASHGRDDRSVLPRATPEQVSLELVTDRRELIEYEPLMVSARLRNATATPVSVPGEFDLTYLRVEYKEVGTERWKPIEFWWRPKAASEPAAPQKLSPEEPLTGNWWLYTFDSNFRPIFTTGNDYHIRLVHPYFIRNLSLQSNAVKISATPAAATEREALRRLLKGEGGDTWTRPLFDLLPEVLLLGGQRKKFERIESFVGAFPESVYSIYLRRIYVLLARDRATVDGAKGERVESYLADLRARAPWALPSDPASVGLAQKRSNEGPPAAGAAGRPASKPLAAEDVRAVQEVVRAYRAALVAGDAQGCLALFADDYTRGNLSKGQIKEVTKLDAAGVKKSVDEGKEYEFILEDVTATEGGAVAEFTIAFRMDGRDLYEPQPRRARLVLQGGAWRILEIVPDTGKERKGEGRKADTAR